MTKVPRMIKFTMMPQRLPFWIRGDQIKQIQKNPENLGVTVIITFQMSQQGPVGFEVIEPIEYAAELVNASLEDRPVSAIIETGQTRGDSPLLKR